MTAPEPERTLHGMFWQCDTPERRVPGHLRVNGRPTLETVGQIFIERANSVAFDSNGMLTRMAVSGNSDALVADWEPRNIHGELDDGTSVSVVGAQGGRKLNTNFADRQYRQQFRTTRHVIFGEQVDDQQAFESCKFRLVGPRWWASEDEQATTSDGGRLATTDDGDDRWLQFTPSQPLTVRNFDRSVLSPARTLASLVTDIPTATADLYVRRSAESAWRKVYRAEKLVPFKASELLDSAHLSADRFTRWIDFRRRSDSLDAAAIDDHSGASIQTAVLTLAAVAEGLHRRLFDEKKRVPALSKADLVRARRAARTAATVRVGELDRAGRSPLSPDDIAEFKKAMNDAFGFINEQTFRTRMSDLADVATAAVPNIVVAFADWPRAIHGVRNTLAHQGTQRHDDSIDQFYDLVIALNYSLVWVLRTVLLVEAGFDAETLQRAYNESSRYTHHIANTRNLLANTRYAAQ